MEKLTIDLDCNKETCGYCKFLKRHYGEECEGGWSRYWCELFEIEQKMTKSDNLYNGYFRLPECITACKQKNDNELRFTEHELKAILRCVMKCLPKGRASGDLTNKIVKMINALKEIDKK